MKTYPANIGALEKDGVQLSVGPNVWETTNPPSQKTHLSLGNPPLPLKKSTATTHAANPIHSSVHLSSNILLNRSHHREEGSVRRKKMRIVSQDDYLLARGANPRTGVITPSVHSGSSSLDDQEWLRIKQMSQPAKWRLKGDQWVSLSLDEPSPLPNPPYQPNDGTRGRLLRIPPELARGRGPQSGTHIHDLEQHKIDSLKRAPHNTSQMDQTRTQNDIGLPRAEKQKDLVQSASFPTRLSPHSHDDFIRRKPLRTPPGKPLAENLFHSNDLPEASTEKTITKPGPVEQIRASSMPTPRKIRYCGPEDVGKALPALPFSKGNKEESVQEEPQSQGISYLGLRPGDWIEDIPHHTIQNCHGSKKRPPCLPMNDIQYRSYRLEKNNMRVSPPTTKSMHTKKLGTQQRKICFATHTGGRSPGPQRLRAMIPPRNYQLGQATRMGQRPAHSGIPGKHATPYSPTRQPNPQCQPISNNEQMRKNKMVEVTAAAHTSPSTTTPIATHITTITPLPEDVLVSSSWTEMPSPLRLGRQRARTTPRPVMPERSEGTHSVPQVSPQKATEAEYQWSVTGMSDSDVSAVSTSAGGSPERDLIHRPLRPSHRNAAGPGRSRKAAEGVTDASHPTESCRSCREASLDAKPHNMHGSIPIQESRGAENMDPKVDLSLASGFLQGATEDHSSCCSECCAVGCHGSCLGHRSPLIGGSSSGSTSGLRAMKDAFRNSIRLSRRIRIRTSAGGSQETETEEVAELEAPMSWEMSGPVSLGLPVKVSSQDCWGSGSGIKDGPREKRVASNASASSAKTWEMPTAGGGFWAIVEALTVPFSALRMWVRKHPQLLALLHMVMVRLFEMSKHVLGTMGKAYRVAYIYSKTGRISAGKQAPLSGFVRDCVKALVYCLILGAVAMMVGRVLAVFAGVGSWLIWCLSWVAWVVKTVVGLGILW